MAEVIEMFKKKIVSSSGRTPEETIEAFHSKLDEVMDNFQHLSVMEKYEVMESVISINKSVFELYIQLKKRHEFDINN